MLGTIFCKHFRSMSEHSTCSAGVAYESFKGTPYQTFEKRPCFCKPGQPPLPGCDLLLLPTAEEIEAEEREFERLFARTDKARAAIVEHLGGPWRKGMDSSRGSIACPICVTGALNFSRSGYNGHIHAGCTTEGCVRWME